MCGETPMNSMPGSRPFSDGVAVDHDAAGSRRRRRAAPGSRQTPPARRAALRRGAGCPRCAAPSTPASCTARSACRSASSSAAPRRSRRWPAAGCRKLRMKSDAPMSSSSDSATSATTSVLRSHARPPPAVPRPPSFSASCRSAFDACSAGARPKTMPVEPGDADGVEHRADVERPVDEVRNVVGRDRHVHQLQAAVARRHAERHAEQADDDALGEELAEDLPAAGAERRADRHLARSASTRARASGWRR